MKQVGEPRLVTAANAWGRDQTVIHTVYEIEECDVRGTRQNYLGHNRPGVTFAKADVGKQIIEMSDGSGWRCWSWKS